MGLTDACERPESRVGQVGYGEKAIERHAPQYAPRAYARQASSCTAGHGEPKGPAVQNCMAKTLLPKRPRQRHFLRQWREHHNLTQEAAADRIGVKQSTLSRIERGLTPYDQDFLEAAAVAYGTSPASLIMRDPSDSTATWALSEQMAKADPETQARIQGVVLALLKAG